jgi:hypothetical protein
MTPLNAPIILLILAVTLGYALTCLIWPFGNCRRCGGTGKIRSPFGGNSFRLCRRCHTTGRRVRLGRKAWKHWRDLRRKSA